MNRILEIATLVIFGALLLFPKLVTLAIVLWVVIYVISIIKYKAKFKLNRAFLVMPAFYLVYVFGLMNTQDFAYANMDLGSKLSLVIFPLLFSFPIKINLKWIAKGFAILCVVSGVVSIVDSYFLWKESPEIGKTAFMGSYLGYEIHTTYLSWYYTTAIGFVVYKWLYKKRLFNSLLDVLVVLFLTPFIYFLTSFAGLLLFVILIGFFVALKLVQAKGKKIGALAILSVGFLSIGAYFIPYVNQEVNRGVNEFTDAFNQPNIYREENKTETESFKARALLWSVAAELAIENPMGYGSGDGKNTFVEKCKSYDLEVGKKGLNPHNQYLQTTLAVGAIGLFVLFSFILIQLQFAWEKKNFLLFCLVFGMAFHALFESVLELQSGIVFFCLLTCILINESSENWKNLKNG